MPAVFCLRTEIKQKSKHKNYAKNNRPSIVVFLYEPSFAVKLGETVCMHVLQIRRPCQHGLQCPHLFKSKSMSKKKSNIVIWRGLSFVGNRLPISSYKVWTLMLDALKNELHELLVSRLADATDMQQSFTSNSTRRVFSCCFCRCKVQLL